MHNGTIRDRRGTVLLLALLAGIAVLVAISLILLFLSRNSEVARLRETTNDLTDRLTAAEARCDSLGSARRVELDSLEAQSARLRERISATSPGTAQGKCWPPFGPGRQSTVDRLRKQGLADPDEDLVRDLQAHPDLIPFEGVVGGTMGFYYPQYIFPLDHRYLIAWFDDGHIGGSMLLKYDVENGTIRWTVLDARLD